MPYDGEFAQYKPIHRIAESRRVKDLLGKYRVRVRGDEAPDDAASLVLPELSPSNWLPNLVLAVDGSYSQVAIENGFPGAEAAYVTVASVLIDVAKMRTLDRDRPVDPKEFRTIESSGSTDSILPSCNIVFDGEISVRDSFRKVIFEILESERLLPNGETLLETYEALLKHKSGNSDQKCPCDACPIEGSYGQAAGKQQCACSEQRVVYSTDALRFHERFQAEGKNGAIISEVMQVLERLHVVNLLRTLLANGWLSTLQRLAIVVDGPLAVFGQPAWLSQAIYKELCSINEIAKRDYGCDDMLLVGIEKTGQFVDHFAALDRHTSGEIGKFPKQQVALLTDQYIKRNIIYSESDRPYGDVSYFGRKFFYRTSSGAMIVASVPFLSPVHRELSRADVSQFPRLADAMNLLDKLISSRYPNSLAPLIAAHAEASIPANLGTKVLGELAKKILQEAV